MIEKEFIQRFSGLKRAFGFAHMNSAVRSQEGKLKPVYSWGVDPVTDEDYMSHLNGTKAIGIQPCDDEGKAMFGAIDIDDKQHSYKNFPYKKYLDIIARYNLPIVPVKSKSGGLHLFVFLNEPVDAKFIRKFFSNILFSLELPINIEIYPKQTMLGVDADGKKDKGQFINLPYFDKKERLALNLDGTEFTFEQFIAVVKENVYTQQQLEDFSIAHVKSLLQGGSEEFLDGPPCLQKLTQNFELEKLTDYRDRFLYNYMVFAKKKYPDDWTTKILEGARKYIKYDSVWGDNKVLEKIKSWGKETKGHLCNEDPIVNVCLKEECRIRKFGYLSDKKQTFPILSGLIKITYPEPEYTFNVQLPDGQEVKSIRAKNIKQIIIQDELRALIASAANFVAPKVKGSSFQEAMDSLFGPTISEEAPPKGTSPDELLEEYLREYVNGPQARTYASFRSGSTLIEGDCCYFKYRSFYDTLKNKEWKKDRAKTAEDMKRLFDAQFEIEKRFPKASGEKGSHPPILAVQLPMDKFTVDSVEIENVQIKNKTDIM